MYREERARRAKQLTAADRRLRRAGRNIYARAGMTIATLLFCLSLV